MNVEDTASQISVNFGIQHDWRDNFWSSLFPQVVQRH